MLARQRHQLIIEAVQREGSIRVRDLSTLLGVSDMTVRRDLEVLAQRELIDKVHGGAIKIRDRSTDEPGFDVKQRRQLREKSAIARAAVGLVEPGSAVALSAGTTTWAMAKLLTGFDQLTVVTNSPTIAQVFYRTPDCSVTVVLTGGVRTPSDALVGPLATAAVSNLHVDMALIGVHGMDGRGYSTPNLAEAELNQALVRAARQVVVLADHTKWNTQGLATIAPLGAASVVISDDGLCDEAREAFTELDHTELRIVAVDGIVSSKAS